MKHIEPSPGSSVTAPAAAQRCDICGPYGALASRYVTADSEDVDDTTARWSCILHLPTAVETVGLDGQRLIRVTRICRPDPRRRR